MAELNLKDFTQGELKNLGGSLPHCLKAVDELNSTFDSGEVEVISLLPFSAVNHELEPPITYQVADHLNPDSAYFSTSRFVGYFSSGDITINIKPRFGKDIFNHILKEATDIYIPESEARQGFSNDPNSWKTLSALLWKSLLNKALANGSIPKSYVVEISNKKNFKGRLDIPRHIKANLTDSSRFYCKKRILTPDCTINRTIVHLLNKFEGTEAGRIFNEFYPFRERLVSQGVRAVDVTSREIDSISYTRLTESYRPLMALSKRLLENHNIEAEWAGCRGSSFFIDMAELWEAYLLKVLRKRLDGSLYDVFSPNINGGQWMLQDDMRQFRPDIIIRRNGRVVMVIDAKYKGYRTLGKYASVRQAVSREDFYQVTSYIHHYGASSEPIAGVFTSPVSDDKMPLKAYTGNSAHKIGLINLNLTDCATVDELHNEEICFAERISRVLENI